MGVVVKQYRLPKQTKLCKNRSFQAVYRSGKSYANKMAVLYVVPKTDGHRQIGFAAGKRLGSAVVRNRVKRLLREAYRLNQHKISQGVDLVLVGRQAMVEADLRAAARAFLDLCRRAGILL
ncbi:ribonuclease P protein component [Methylomusa anaerophila]|uniref:Ribonuclease P protein component n=2 Tax=Methylomusa anaerophila TaxID=1930071 RepID=A0A348AHM2_9FIRM|nr:ribonuclease P protein component [Methylomusa anaerophila]